VSSRTEAAADLSGVSVLVAGAGLAGLTAAADLVSWGANVRIVDARDRVGGRVQTARDGFVEGQHGEAGADFIDEGQHAIRDMAERFGLPLVRILTKGFGYARPTTNGTVRIVSPTMRTAWARMASVLEPLTARYNYAEKRWDTPIATELARSSVSQWLERTGDDPELRTMATGLRGFFLADPEQLSLLALVDQFASDPPGAGKMFRIKGGNDRLPAAMAAQLGDRLHLETELVAVAQRGPGVRAALKTKRQTAQLQVDYAVLALPATLLRRIPITPALPAQQHEAIVRLPYGHATRTLLQYERRFWRALNRPRAFGTPLPIGAVWEANEEQRGRPGILSLLAGGSASDATAAIVDQHGVDGLTRSLAWLGAGDMKVQAWRQFRWETDPWARGGYAVFDTSFDPGLRAWLARPNGRLFFAGEHTSLAWQGYMNGAIESGHRAAAEIAAVHRL
jgi:monoamine oxidase